MWRLPRPGATVGDEPETLVLSTAAVRRFLEDPLQGAARAMLRLRAKGLRPEDVQKITALIGEGQVKVVCEPEASKKAPANSYDAQFSVHYAMVGALIYGKFGLDQLEEPAFRAPEVQALLELTGYALDPNTRFPRYYSGEVVVETKDGRTLRAREEFNRGSDGQPLSEADVVRKFTDNAARVLSPSRVQQVLELTMALDRAADVVALTDALAR
jgi:2-methylcitrate dehydratase PrpD